jgi:uracil-DNA glycosylase
MRSVLVRVDASDRAQKGMQTQGVQTSPSNPSAHMPATDDEIREKYLERAIRELNALTRELQACPHCPRGHLMPVLGSGHPQADVMLLKHSALPSEIEEGVAFYGRSGGAIMKSLKRLSIDPLAVYGTLCVKCPLPDPTLADPACIARVVEELAIVQPRIVVVMGEEALACLNDLEVPLARPLQPKLGEIQSLTPMTDALYTPNIDDSLDEQDAKREFWAAFRALGDWWAAQPPY